MIHFKHIRNHGLTTTEYKEKFPGHALRVQTEESKKKLSSSKRGKPSALKGRSQTPEHRLKTSQSIKLAFATGKIVHWNSGKTTPENVRAKIAETNRTSQNRGNAKQRLDKHDRMKLAANNFNCEIIEINDETSRATAKCLKCSHVFSFTNQVFYPARLSKINKLCPVCQPRITYSSKNEKEVLDFIRSVYSGSVVPNDRSVLGGREIDIYCPDLKIGFEFTGLYWHAEKQNPENKHLIWKMQFAAKEGVTLITIFEDEWASKPNIVKSRIAGLLGLHTEKIHARTCIIKHVDAKMKNAFLTANHIQGKDTASVAIGLYKDDSLVSIATFKKSNFVKGGDGSQWELSRFCSLNNTRVVGAAGKLIHYFMNTLNTEKLPLISYADRRWSTGQLYKSLGFTFSGISSPSFWYTNDYKLRVHRSALMKHRLIETEEDKLLTGWELAQRRGYDRIWDCGTTKWVLDK